MLRTVLIDMDSDSRAALRRMLGAHSSIVVVGEYKSLEEGLAEVASQHPQLIIAEAPYDPQAKDDRVAVHAIESLARALPDAAIIATGMSVTADFVIKIIRAGALEFVRRPLNHEDLTAALEKVFRLRRGSVAPPRQPGRVTSVFATKGGLGVTTVATNLAVCLAERPPGNVILIDLDTRQSDVATFLNLRATYSVLDAIENLSRLDESFLRGLLVRHPSGVTVLPGPSRVERVQLASERVRAAIEIIRSHFDHLVLDLRHDLDPGTIAALEASDTILFLTALNVSALRSTSAGLAAFRHLGLDLQKVKIVVMREDTGEDVTLKHAREALGVPITWRTPSDYPAAIRSINSGRPVVTAAPRSKLTKSLRQIADALAHGARVARESPAARVASLARLVWTPKGSTGEG